MIVNSELLRLARERLTQETEKQAFTPSGAGGAPGGDPAAMPPGGDPAAMGGMPPGAAPPPGMDPAAMGGMPPGGGAPPPPPPPDAGGGAGGLGSGVDVGTMIQQAVQQAVQQAMGGAPGMAGAAGAAGAGAKPVKANLEAVAMDVFQIKKMLTNIYQINEWPMPPDIIDGPNRDPATGMPMPPGAPGSTSDPARPSSPAPAGGGGAGPSSAIQPIQPMPGAFPEAGGGGGKTAGVTSVGTPHTPTAIGLADPRTLVRTAAVRALLNRGARR